MPPPMALHEVCLEYNAVDVAITMNDQDPRSVWIAVAHVEGCSLYEWPLRPLGQDAPTHKWTVIPGQSDQHTDRVHLRVGVSSRPSGTPSILLLSSEREASVLRAYDQEGLKIGELSSNETAIEGILTNGPCSSQETYILTDDRGNGTEKTISGDLAVFNQSTKLNILTPSFKIAGADALRCKDIIFSLADNGSLFANERQLARNCTSFLVTPAHLIYTTSQHLVKFVHLADSIEGKLQVCHFRG